MYSGVTMSKNLLTAAVEEETQAATNCEHKYAMRYSLPEFDNRLSGETCEKVD
jgi:hypothetical protein